MQVDLWYKLICSKRPRGLTLPPLPWYIRIPGRIPIVGRHLKRWWWRR